MSENLIMDKSYKFALMIVELYQFLTNQQKEFILSKQLLRSGTYIGANVNEAQAALSRRDFVSKISISSKEARETKYWLHLLSDSGYINKNRKNVNLMFEEIESIINITTKIVKTGQQNEKSKK